MRPNVNKKNETHSNVHIAFQLPLSMKLIINLKTDTEKLHLKLNILCIILNLGIYDDSIWNVDSG